VALLTRVHASTRVGRVDVIGVVGSRVERRVERRFDARGVAAFRGGAPAESVEPERTYEAATPTEGPGFALLCLVPPTRRLLASGREWPAALGAVSLRSRMSLAASAKVVHPAAPRTNAAAASRAKVRRRVACRVRPGAPSGRASGALTEGSRSNLRRRSSTAKTSPAAGSAARAAVRRRSSTRASSGLRDFTALPALFRQVRALR
jgi:hypothetical protein